MVRGNSADVVIKKAFYYVQSVQTCKFKCVTHGKKQSNIVSLIRPVFKTSPVYGDFFNITYS